MNPIQSKIEQTAKEYLSYKSIADKEAEIAKKEKEQISSKVLGMDEDSIYTLYFETFGSLELLIKDMLQVKTKLYNQIELAKDVVDIPKEITDLVKFIIIFMILLVLLLIIGVMPGIAWINLPILIMCQLLFIMGCSCLAAAITPFFPDFRLLTESGLTLMMFLSGIFYESKTIPINFQVFFFANPMAVMIDAFRITLLENRHPNWLLISYVFFISNVLLAVALNILKRFDRVYPRMTFA